ncbi:hypothetical protein O0L34_g8508 [Tuta absoluta]|nr:hypothetical protein O0L34_g8508 [Tuta absoluta]
MVSTGWNELLQSWPHSLRSVVESSWRISTLKTYKNAWSRWTNWCHSRSINPKDPTAAEIAFYLAHLFRSVKLSYKTILVHKSVIVNFSNPLKSAELSSHTLVQRVLKGMANESASKSCKPAKPPIWNPQVVITWLMNNDSRTDSLFEVSRRCALLLLLASGRRVHDLTLLSIAPGNLIMESESVVMWPVFGSKTDTLRHRQSGWQLTVGAHPNVDPVRWIRLLLEISETRRSAGSIKSLFVSTRGSPRPASRAVIAGWIRTLLRDAGVNASAGSTRSAVASLSWVEQYSVDDILARGNWTSINTLARFYRKPLAQNYLHNVQSLASTFNPIS